MKPHGNRLPIRKELGIIRRYLSRSYDNRNQTIKVFNDLDYNGIRDHWLVRFAQYRGVDSALKRTHDTLSFIGVHDHPFHTIRYNRSKFKVFTTWENIHVPNWASHHDNYFIDDERVQFALGFDYGDKEKYIRFPYWLLTAFSPTDSLQDIKTKCERINRNFGSNYKERKKFCAFICRYDYFGDRAALADIVEKVAPLNYPSGFRHNDDDLRGVYSDNKYKYLSQFKFNLCPENSNSDGYVTEKLFDAFSSGCIPVYWGSNNNPEPGIINPNSIVFLSPNGDNGSAVKLLQELNDHENAFLQFSSQLPLTNDAPELIYGYFQRLEKKLMDLF